MGPTDKKSDVINEQHAIYDIEKDVNMRGKVGQAKFGWPNGGKAAGEWDEIGGSRRKGVTFVEGQVGRGKIAH